MGESRINDGTNLSSNNHTHNDSVCDPLSAQGHGAPWYFISSPIESLYEVVVMAGNWYGYKRVGSRTQKTP